MNDGAAIVARARSLIGTRFRAQGRSVEQGLDCFGVVVRAAGIDPKRAPDDYALRGGNLDAVDAGLIAVGFERVSPDQTEAGDVLVVRSAPEQLHAVVLTPSGHVHAHAGLRRVVETPAPVPWPVLSAWRLAEALC